MAHFFQKSSVNGIVQMVLSLFSLEQFGRLWYLYHYTAISFLFMYSNWLLLLFGFIGFLGFFIGLSVYLKKRKVKFGYYSLIGLFLVGLIADFIVMY